MSPESPGSIAKIHSNCIKKMKCCSSRRKPGKNNRKPPILSDGEQRHAHSKVAPVEGLGNFP